jgi:hypothetical protein
MDFILERDLVENGANIIGLSVLQIDYKKDWSSKWFSDKKKTR